MCNTFLCEKFKLCFCKNGPSTASILFVFSLFNIIQIDVSNHPSSKRLGDLKFEHEPPPITTSPGLFFLYFGFSIQLTINVQYKYLPMTGFELQTSGVGSNCSTTACVLFTSFNKATLNILVVNVLYFVYPTHF